MMYALCDATSMYASCEKVFDPYLRRKPVIVLSNNDGCIVAACPIAKRLGFKKFVPYFQVQKAAEVAGIIVKSSNYELYADMSSRMMDTIARFADDVYIYSIDECFARFDNTISESDWYELGLEIRKTVWREVKLPVGVGFGPTATLAKAANHASKKLPGATGSFVLCSDKQKQRILKQMAVSDVWGIGSRLEKKLSVMGISNAYEFSQQPAKRMGKYFSILVENIVRELNGEVRIEWDGVRPAKKEIYSTRSFGARITEIEQLKCALSSHAEVVGKKLRLQQSTAKGIIVFAHSSPHDSAPMYRKSIYHSFAVPTADTRNFINAVTNALTVIYRSNVRFYKCGVGLVEISDSRYTQDDLFTPSNDNTELMKALDGINDRFGRQTMYFAARGIEEKFKMRRDFLSDCFTTRWKDIPKIDCT